MVAQFYREFPKTGQGANHLQQHIIIISLLIIVIQIVDGQFLRDGSDHLHPDSGLGLQSLLAPLQKVQRSDLSGTAL